MNQQIEVGSIVKVYKGTPCAIDGGIAKVLDKDSNTGDLFIGEDLNKAMWVNPKDVEKLDFDRPETKELWLKNLGWFIAGAMTCLIIIILKVNFHG